MKNVFIDPLRTVNFFGKFSKYAIVPLFAALFVSFFVSLFFHTAFSTDSNENNGFNIGDNTNNFLFLGYPQRTDDGRWRIRWNSIPGKTYELQRTVSRDLTNAEWTVVTNVKAAGSNTFVIDPLAFERSFYRVKTSDGVPPESDGSFFFDGDLDYFVALNSSGLPVEGARIPITSDGVLSPFEFRPSGRSTGGAGGVFYIRFPDGGRIVDLNGSITIEFTNAIAGFGRRCPFQLERPLSIKTNVTQRLDIDAPDVRSIVVAFGLSPTNGIDVILFGKFPFTIVSGIFDEEGLRGGRLVYRGLNFPLPEKSGDYPSFAVELMPKGGLRIPFSGEFKAPDGSDFGPTFRIPSHRPLWVEFKPNGDIGMGGRGELSFPNGMKFGVDFGFNEPHYFLSISASGVNIPLIDSLADFFPPPPQVPNQIDQINLDAARERLGVYNRAFLNFSTSLVGESPGGETTPSFLPSGFSATASSVLEAWGCAALCGATLEGGFLVTALKHAGMKSAAQPDLRVCISQYSSLLRIKKASSSGTLTIDLTVKNELDNAIGEALASVRSRARNTENIASLNNLFLIMSDLLEAEALRQELGMDLDGALYNALGGMLQRFCSDLTSRLGVQPGVFTPVSAHISNMNYYDAYEHVRLLIKTLDLAQQLGIESELNAPIEEAIGQLALRVWSELSDELDGAEARGDYAGFCNVLEDVLDFIELKQSGIFPEHPSLSNLPGAESIENFTARLDRVWQVEYEREYGYQGLGKVGKEMRRLVFILRRLSQSHAYPQSVVQKEFEKIQNSLDFAFDSLNSASLGELKDILSAGVSAKEFAERFNLSEAVSWENQRLPVLITRLANVAVTESGWSEIYESVQLLLSVSDCYRTNGNAMARLLYLKQAGMLAGAANQVAHQLAQSERVRRNANPGLQIADMVLPGDICVDRVAGSVKYNRLTREFGGVFSGQLRLPKHNLNLTVNNASFSSGGVFDLNASGAVEFPPFNPKGRLIIPEDRPLHISYQEDRQVRFSGAGRMELNNGMVFEVFLKLDDPLYQFNISARGIRFDAGDNLRVMVPTLPDGQTFSSEVARDLNEYFMSLSSTLDGVRENVGLPQVSPPGEPPQFSSPALIIPADSLAAWVDAQIADLRLNINRDYSATFGAVKANLKTIAGELRQRRGEILPEELKMRLTVLSKLCSIKERQQEVVNSPEFAEFLQETESAILELLQRALTKDESFRDNALEMVGQYKNVAGCYNPESSVKILAAIESYVKSQWLLFARTNGISETTGELVNPDLMPLTNYWIFYSRWKNYVRLVTEYNLLDLQSVSPEWIRKAGQTLAMRWRSAVLGELRRIDPTDSRDYTKLGFLTRDMSLILCGALENIFEYPSGNIEQLEGADRPYEYLNELRNTFLKRLQATAYVVTNANKFPIGEIVKYRFVSQPSSFVKAEDIRFVERFVCKLKLQADPVSQFIWQTLGPETQEILINYKPSNYLLTACDIISIYEFVETLSSPGHPPTDALSLYLWNRFSGGSQEIILTGGQDINKLLWTIANELNAIIKGPSIYNSTRFSGINLSSRTRNLLNANPQGNDLQKLNRWLLEDAYTNIVKSFDSPGTAQEQMKNTLAIHLDTLIHSGAIYTSERFAGVRLSVDTQERLATANQETVVLLNRRLLEDAYPEEIPPNDQQVMTLYVPALELLREPLENESNKCGGGDDWMTPAEREIIANADSIYAEAKLNSAEVLLLQTGTTGDLQGAIKLLKELIWFAGWAEEKQLPQAPKFAGCINRLTITFSILAEQQRAWWYLNEYTDILLDAAESGLLRNAPVVKNALIQEANNVLRTSAKLVESLSHLFPSLRPVDLPLPGKINIERIYGGISYNRSSEKIQGNFGGRIEFPDLQNAFFEISNAMLDNNLNFSIVASIGGPASGGPFHLPNGTRVTANINALGGPRQSFIFNGSGTLKLTNGPEFAVNVFYRTDPTVLEFNSVASNLKWELDKNFVIFDAGFGFQIRSDAQSGELNVRGSIGLFGNDFIPQDRPLAPEDFKLFIDRAEFYAGFHEDRIQITFSNGTLRLPESIFRAGVCPNAPTNAKPEIALSPLNPLQATLLFRGAHDEPEL
ncbi:MAG: hypothetical protein N2487_03250, partial [Verrucomicrobiae bacterium]|nr:hypothetical protein [Verrucomicrobiae bacterium]